MQVEIFARGKLALCDESEGGVESGGGASAPVVPPAVVPTLPLTLH